MAGSNQMYDVGGVLLLRPFKARRLGYFALWQSDLHACQRLYMDLLGFRQTDRVARESRHVATFVHAIGHDGHCIRLYHCMEQIGWDGRPRPAAERRRVSADWPDRIEATTDSFVDQIMQGPLG